MVTTIDIMVEGWNDVISGYSAHLFNDPCALYSWIRKRFFSHSYREDTECDVLLSRLEAVYSRNNVVVVGFFHVDCVLRLRRRHCRGLHRHRGN